MSEMIVRTKEDFQRAVASCPDEVVFKGEMARVVKRVIGGTCIGGAIGFLITKNLYATIAGAIIGLGVGLCLDDIKEFLKNYKNIEVSVNGTDVKLS